MFIPESPKPIQNPAPLSRATGLTEAQIKTLKAHWIISIQELLALTELPATAGPLAKLLGIDNAELEKISIALRKQLSVMRGNHDEDDEALTNIEYASGALTPPAAMRAGVKYETIPCEEAPPPALSYSDELPPVRNQGSRGACVAYAAAAVREFMEIRQRKRSQPDFNPRSVDFSEQFIYWWCKEKDGLPNVSGTYPYLGMQCLVEAGVAREKTWPYHQQPTPDNEGQGPPPEEAIEEAPSYRIGKVIHLRPDDIDSMKAALLQGRSVMIAIPMFNSWFHSRTTRQFGKINLPLPDEKSLGAHAMALVGYVDDEAAPGGGYFLLRNAWKPWAMLNPLGKGLGAIPYEFIRAHNTLADTGEWLAAADIYIRDNADDRGEAPSRGLAFNSPDIWVRREQDGIETHQPPEPGRQNWIYIRAWNKGPETATRVQGEIFTAPVSPSIWPNMWRPAGAFDLPDIPAGDNVLAAMPWTPADAGPCRILVRLNSAEDPARHQWAVRYDNNIAQKNLMQITLHPGQSASIAFPIYGLPDELTLRHIRIDRKNFRRGRINLEISGGQTYRGKPVETEDQVLQAFSGQATETRTATLAINMDQQATAADGGAIIISQQYSDVLIGRMLLEVRVTDDGGK